MPTIEAILAVLRRYRVQKHYRASVEAKVTRYAVYAGKGEQLTEPKPFVDAKDEAQRMTARAIAELFGH